MPHVQAQLHRMRMRARMIPQRARWSDFRDFASSSLRVPLLISAHSNIGGPSVVMPYLVAIASMRSKEGMPPGGVAADISTNKLQKKPGVVAMRSRASEVVKF